MSVSVLQGAGARPEDEAGTVRERDHVGGGHAERPAPRHEPTTIRASLPRAERRGFLGGQGIPPFICVQGSLNRQEPDRTEKA